MNPHSEHNNQSSQQTIWSFLLIVGVLITLYTLTYSGVFRVDDEHILGARAQSLALWGRLEEPQVFGNQRVQELQAYGDQATQIEPLHSVLGAVFYRLGLFLGVGGAQAYLLQNIYITALTAGLIYLTARAQNASQKASVFAALLFGMGSMAWPYAMAYYRDSLAMLFASLVLLGFTRRSHANRRSRRWGYVLITMGILGGVLSKNSTFVLFPAVVIGIIVEAFHKHGMKRRFAVTIAGLVGACALVLLILALLPPEGFLARFSLEYYLFVLKHFISSLSFDTVAAFLGPFFSPSKSIFLFTPLLIAFVPSLWDRGSDHHAFVWLTISYSVLLALAQALFYGERWAGTYGWGLRYMLPVLPGMFVLIARSLAILWRHRLAKWALITLVVASILIQVSAVLIPWVHPYIYWSQLGLEPFSPQSPWQVRYLSIPYHLSHMFQGQLEQIAWTRAQMVNSTAWFVPLVLFVLISMLVWLLFQTNKRRNFTAPGRGARLILIAAFVFPIFPNLVLLKGDHVWGTDQQEFRKVLNYVSLSSQADDVLLIDAYGTELWNVWMNRWDQPLPWYGLPFENPAASGQNGDQGEQLPPSTLSLLEAISRNKSRVWYVGSSAAPDYLFSGEQAWLESRFRVQERLVAGADEILEIRLYDFLQPAE
jgi:hypothetical protein